MCGTDCILALLAIIFPPLPVWVRRGLCSADSLINICLCLLGFIPGLLHAWYIIVITPDHDPGYERVPDVERGLSREQGVRYIYVQQQGQGGSSREAGRRDQMNYGAVAQPGESGRGQRQIEGGHSQRQLEGAPPPAYEEAVKGDHKVQRP